MSARAGRAPAQGIAMDLIAFQYDRPFVVDALSRGEIDYLEHVGEAAEADFFRHLIRRDVLNRLAERDEQAFLIEEPQRAQRTRHFPVEPGVQPLRPGVAGELARGDGSYLFVPDNEHYPQRHQLRRCSNWSA